MFSNNRKFLVFHNHFALEYTPSPCKMNLKIVSSCILYWKSNPGFILSCKVIGFKNFWSVKTSIKFENKKWEPREDKTTNSVECYTWLWWLKVIQEGFIITPASRICGVTLNSLLELQRIKHYHVIITVC